MYFMIFKGVFRMFQGSLKFQGCFDGVLRVVLGSVSKKFHIVWHPSQLPEQKEGLFFQWSSSILGSRPTFQLHLSKYYRTVRWGPWQCGRSLQECNWRREVDVHNEVRSTSTMKGDRCWWWGKVDIKYEGRSTMMATNRSAMLPKIWTSKGP